MTTVLKSIIKHLLPSGVRKWLRILVGKPKYVKCINQRNIQPSAKPRIFLLGVPSHPNLGDQAIAIAEMVFLTSKYPNTPVYDITFDEVTYAISYLKKIITIDDIIIIHGGGNMGTIWYNAEIQRFSIIKEFLKNKIIQFPQSIYYEETEDGSKKLELSRQKYENHSNLHVVARETYSFELMKTYYPKCNIYFTPDIVLFLDRQEPRFKRSGVLMCIRVDIEKNLSENNVNRIHGFLNEKYDNIMQTDTVLTDILEISLKDRDKYLNNKLNEFKKAELVITDRLHGMVFAAITATPCIALACSNHKVKGLYEWIRDLDYIKYTEDIGEIPSLIDNLHIMSDIRYSNESILKKLDLLCDIIGL